MTYQPIDLGLTAGDGTGDTIRAGGDKLNDNFVEIYTLLGSGTVLSSGISADGAIITLTNPSISGKAEFQDGSVSAPSITNDGDTNTGIFFSAQDALSVTTAAALRGTFNSTGLAVVGNVTASGTVEPAGDTAADDAAAIGYTAAEGLILTGQGSTSDITLKNDADAIVFTVPTGTDDILFPDNAKVMFGASSDLQITHDGSNSLITDTGTGDLVLRASNDIFLTNVAGNVNYARFNEGGAASLYYDGTVKFVTSSAGGTLTGTWEVTTALVPDASDGAALGTTALEWSDLFLADGAVINFGDDQEVTITHVADTGLLLNGTNVIQFNDASQNIGAPSNAILDINATDEIELNSTLIDVNGNLDVSGTGVIAGAVTTAALTASGIIKTDDTTAATNTTDGSLQTDGGLSVAADAVIGDDIIMLSDAAQIAFGTNSEITLAHVHNVGLTLTHVTAGDNLPVVFQLKSEEDIVVANEVIASIEFAAGDSDGTDGATVAAGIHAIAEGTFSATANATKLVFTTGVSETAASSATAKATLSSIGDFTVAGDLIIKDGGLIGSASDVDAIAIASNGVVTFSQSPVFSTGINIANIDLDSATEMEAAVVDADLFMIDDGGGGTMKSMLASRLKTYIVSEVGAAADNISGGDAAINLTTSAGNITLDAAGNDTDIILKGTDGGADTTFLTIDGSAAGEATFNAGIVIADAGNIGSASDKDAIAIASNGVVTMNQIPVFSAGINVSSGTIAGTLSTAAQGNVTSLGTLTALTVDNIIINGTNIGHTSDTDAMAIASNGVVTFSQIPVMPANSIDSDEYIDGSIDREHLVADIIDGTKIADNAIGAEHIAADAVGSSEIAANAVGSSEIAANAVGSSEIAANAVGSDQIANGNITFAKMAANSIDSDQYVNGSIDTAHYTAGSVDATALASNAVTTAKINADAVTNAKIADNAIDSEHYAADSIDAEHYAPGSVDATALASNAVTSAKIVNATIVGADIAANTVAEANMANDAIGSAELKSLSTLLIKNSSGTTLKTLYGAGA